TTEKLKAMSNTDVRHWTFAGLKREADGKFKDSDLAKILMDATASPAGAFGARGTPGIMRTVEIMTIQMARRWAYTTFQEWNPDPEIWMAAQALYEQVDRLELYPGLQAEDTKPPGPGAGLCPGYTVSRAILADAIALTRGDRFYTHDFTPSIYTSWGFKDCQRNPSNPDMKNNLIRLGKEKKYSFDRPAPLNPIKAVESTPAIYEITSRGGRGFKTNYGAKAREIIDGGGYFALLDDIRGEVHRRAIQQAVFHNIEHTAPIARNIESKLRALVHVKSFTLVGTSTRCIDIVKDGLPLKTHDHLSGTVFEQQADQMFKDIYSYIFHEVDPTFVLNLNDIVKKHVSYLMRYIEPQVGDSNGILPSLSSIKEAIVSYWVDRRGDCGRFYDSIVANGFSKTDVMNDVLALAVLSTVELSHRTFRDANHEHRERIVAAAFGDEHIPMSELEGYTDVSLGEAVSSVSNNNIQSGDRVFVSLKKAMADENTYPNVNQIVLNRPKDQRLLLGDGLVKLLGEDYVLEVGLQWHAAILLPRPPQAKDYLVAY
ncbi:1164_t:CDS:10, partial [Acaulospora colombiana]